jgi:hypothetical protein
MAKLVNALTFGVAGLLFGGNKKPAPAAQPLPVATRDDAAAATAADDELRRRKGGAADIINGTRGAEAGVGSVGKLVVGN